MPKPKEPVLNAPKEEPFVLNSKEEAAKEDSIRFNSKEDVSVSNNEASKEVDKASKEPISANAKEE